MRKYSLRTEIQKHGMLANIETTTVELLGIKMVSEKCISYEETKIL